MSHKKLTLDLSGIVFKEGDVWVARCLTIDHAAQASNPQTAITDCMRGVMDDFLYALEHDTLKYLKPAPIADWLQFWDESIAYPLRRLRASGKSQEGEPLNITGSAAFARPLSFASTP